MPVVINEFEVVADQPAPASPTRSAASSEAPAAQQQGRGATPHEIESIVQREKERLARVKAH